MFADAVAVPGRIAEFIDYMPKQRILFDEYVWWVIEIAEITVYVFVSTVVYVITFRFARSIYWAKTKKGSFHYINNNRDETIILVLTKKLKTTT